MVRKDTGEALAQDAHLMRQVGAQLASLEGMGLAELRTQYRELYGEDAKSKNLPFLRKKLAYRLQERVEGGLSPAALARIEELAPAELPDDPARPKARVLPALPPKTQRERDCRLPEAGTMISREHKGLLHEVEIKEDGFRYRGKSYTSLSTIAKEITGTAWNGFTFFGLKKGAAHGEA